MYHCFLKKILTSRTTCVKNYNLSRAIQEKWTILTFQCFRWNIEAKVMKSNILVSEERSCRKECTCEISKLYHLPFKSYGVWHPKCDRQTDRRTDRQTTDKVIPKCCYDSQATQKKNIQTDLNLQSLIKGRTIMEQQLFNAHMI